MLQHEASTVPPYHLQGTFAKPTEIQSAIASQRSNLHLQLLMGDRHTSVRDDTGFCKALSNKLWTWNGLGAGKIRLHHRLSRGNKILGTR